MPQLVIDEYLSPVTGTFLLLNGYPLRVRDVTKEPIEIGERDRAFSGKYRSSRRALKRRWRMKTVPMIRTHAEAVKGLLLGLGHYWSFDDDLYSSKGLGPNAGYTATQSPTGGLYGGKASITSITYAVGLPTDEWTVSVARWSGTAWELYAVRADGAKWRNGARDDALNTSWLSVSGGSLTLTGSPTDYDELVAVPYLATDQQIVAWHGLTLPFSALPRLNATGDLVRRGAEDPLVVEAEITGVEIMSFAKDGSWHKDGMVLEFVLEEV